MTYWVPAVDGASLGPENATVGPVDGGWGTALTTLMFERLTIGAGAEGMGYRADRVATALAADESAAADPEVGVPEETTVSTGIPRTRTAGGAQRTGTRSGPTGVGHNDQDTGAIRRGSKRPLLAPR